MTKRELYKILKEHRLYSKFSVICAQAFGNDHERFEGYINSILTKSTPKLYIYLSQIKRMWYLRGDKLKLQQ